MTQCQQSELKKRSEARTLTNTKVTAARLAEVSPERWIVILFVSWLLNMPATW